MVASWASVVKLYLTVVYSDWRYSHVCKCIHKLLMSSGENDSRLHVWKLNSMED